MRFMDTTLLRSWIEIDFNALEENVRRIKSKLPPHTVYVAVVKADAYGHCLPRAILPFIKGGADMFAVANMYEVSRVRELVSSKPILVLSPILLSERKLVFEYDAIPAISSEEEALDFDSLARTRNRVLDVHVKIDTGMGRYGVWHENALPFLRSLSSYKNLRVAGIFTHLSSADCDKNYTKSQIDNFKKVVNDFGAKDILVHMHASAGLNYLGEGAIVNAVRVGLLQYGISPFGEGEKAFCDVLPVLSFKSKVSSVANTPNGKIASVSAGYADGVPMGFTEKSRVLINGKKCEILGASSLDETLVDITNAGVVKNGDEVVFIGSQNGETIDLPSYSNWTKRIPWETMVSIPKRVGIISRSNR